MRTWKVGACLIVARLVVSCGGGDVAEDSTDSTECEPFASQSCRCPDDTSGLQRCSDGEFGECECRPSDDSDSVPTTNLVDPPPTTEAADPPPSPPEPCFVPCGGSPEGLWFLAGNCDRDVGMVCASRVETEMTDIEARLRFTETTMQGYTKGSITTRMTINPCDELGGAPRAISDCDSFAQTMRTTPGLSDVRCTYRDPGCDCSYTNIWEQLIDPTPLSFPSATTMMVGTEAEGVSVFEYCVDGDDLFLRSVVHDLVTEVTEHYRRVVCEPHQLYCGDNNVRECDDIGTGFVSEMPCAAGAEACVDGTCHPIVCTPSDRWCEGGEVHVCDASGTVDTVEVVCTAEEYCDEVAPRCVPRLCNPDSGACDGSVHTSCDAIGARYVGDRTDCAPQSLVCTPEGGCVSSTTFEVASTYSCFTAQYEREVGNRYRVDQVRELVEIETYLTLDTETTVTFSLFESETDTGTYDLVLSKERVVSAMPSGGFASSGPLYFPLQPGRYYLIMARPDGEFGACTSYAGSGVPFGEFGGGLSWGEESVRGSVMVSWYPGSFGVYYQRLTFAE